MHLENFKVGRFVTVAGINPVEDKTRMTNAMLNRIGVDSGFIGIPMKVMAVSPPFLSVRLPQGVQLHFDARNYTITHVTDEYAESFDGNYQRKKVKAVKPTETVQGDFIVGVHDDVQQQQ